MALARRRLGAGALALVLVTAVVLALQLREARGVSGLRPGAGGAAVDPRPLTVRQIETLQTRLRDHPDDVQALGQLGDLYLQQARETGDPAYYPRAEAAFKDALARDGRNVAALLGLGSLALSRHQFREALDWGERARAVAPDTAAIYGIIGDAQTELGLYPEAVVTIQHMIDLKPSLASYSRVSYQRELHGEVEGAIDAMRRAIAAGGDSGEAAAWTRVQLGNLYFNTGQFDAATTEYQHALFILPGYLYAQAGLGRVAAARGDYAAAIGLYRSATATIPVTQFVIELGEVYAAAGQPQAASEQFALAGVQAKLLAANGVNDDLEFALFAADHPEAGVAPAAVVARARAALAARPSIYGHDVLAWALYRAGQYDEAARESAAALALGTRDALLHFHAGAIAEARGDVATARREYEMALQINPNFSVLHTPAARAGLVRLAGR